MNQTNEKDQIDQMNKTGLLNVFCILLVGLLASQFTYMVEMNTWAGSPTFPKGTMPVGDVERGREVFNGKEITCFTPDCVSKCPGQHVHALFVVGVTVWRRYIGARRHGQFKQSDTRAV